MKKVFLLLTPLQIIYIAIAIMTALSAAAYHQSNQNSAGSNQNTIQYQQPTTNPNVASSPTPSPSPAVPYYSLSPTQVPIITAKMECEGGTVRVCEAGYCECVSN